jgi:hypothetical protein
MTNFESHVARPRWLVVLIWAQIAVGVMQMLGAAFEVVNMLAPSILSDVQDNEVMQIHRDEPLVTMWTTFGNAVGLVLGLGFVVGGRRLLAGDRRGLRLSRISAVSTAIYAALGATVSVVYLVPLLLPMLNSGDPDQQAMGVVVLSAIAGSACFFIIFPTILMLTFGRPSVRRSFEPPQHVSA